MPRQNKCTYCNLIFAKQKYLLVHLKRKHKQTIANKRSPLVKTKCTGCGICFATSSFYRHLKLCPNICEANNSKRVVCPYENCSENIWTYASLRRHILNIHNVSIELEEINFTSEQGKYSSFTTW